MEYGKVAGIDKKVSRLVQGCIMLNRKNLEEGYALLDAACAAGITAYDSAHLYGGGEVDRVLGLWMEKRGNREDVVIIGKGAHLNQDRNRVTPCDIASDMADSLVRLRTDYIDLYLLHRDDPTVPVGPIVEALNEHHAAGRIRTFGGSNWTPKRLEEANEYADKHNLIPFTISSPNFSLAEQIEEPWTDCLSISGPSQEAERAWYKEQNMPLFTWSSVARGFFSGKITSANAEEVRDQFDGSMPKSYYYPDNFKRLDRAWQLAEEKGLSVPQIALAYVLSYPLNIHALVGSANAEEVASNVQALETRLSEAEMAWLDLRSESR
ncbi:MAG: aryl-alcohol dehydrogenase-like predicted oxidoreductase [Candidatus Latescibacterota bacterium]|jgi:aryl-alcohol dehydrogenase-like predicted oxidoreductase